MSHKIILGIVVLVLLVIGGYFLIIKKGPTRINELDKSNLIRLNNPRPNQVIQSPLTIKGEARGMWFFEASFPVVLTNWDGLIIAEGIATAQGEWMTTEFVPFVATLKFVVDKNAYSNRGFLILRKDNPSGRPEHDDALEIPIMFADISENTL